MVRKSVGRMPVGVRVPPPAPYTGRNQIRGYRYNTRRGPVYIVPRNGRWLVIYDDDDLGSYYTPEQQRMIWREDIRSLNKTMLVLSNFVFLNQSMNGGIFEISKDQLSRPLGLDNEHEYAQRDV